jgi:UDP:flavonoid glycosyltransferase YjiC (YdhE family)
MSRQQAETLKACIFGAVFPQTYMQQLGHLFACERPDLVVYEASNAGGYLAAKRARIACVAHACGRGVGEDGLKHAIHEHVAACAREADVDFPETPEPGFGAPYFDICPLSMQESGVSQRRLPLRPVPVHESGEVPASLFTFRAGRHLVYLTLGTVFGSTRVLRAAIDGLAALNAEVIVATGPRVDPEELRAVPNNVFVRRWIRQADILPHADLIVHHGGNSTMLGAFCHGLAQLVIPLAADQFRNAETVCRLGAGSQLVGDQLSPEAVRAHAELLLREPSYRQAARTVAREIAAMPEPAEVLPVLNELASEQQLA